MPERDLILSVDEDLFSSAIQNIVENAIDFSSSPSNVEVEVELKDSVSVLSDLDNGQGILEYAVSRVFDRFFSFPRSTNGKKSFGLGLCLSKHIVELHGGQLSLHNRISYQTIVIAEFYFPMSIKLK